MAKCSDAELLNLIHSTAAVETPNKAVTILQDDTTLKLMNCEKLPSDSPSHLNNSPEDREKANSILDICDKQNNEFRSDIMVQSGSFSNTQIEKIDPSEKSVNEESSPLDKVNNEETTNILTNLSPLETQSELQDPLAETLCKHQVIDSDHNDLTAGIDDDDDDGDDDADDEYEHYHLLSRDELINSLKESQTELQLTQDKLEKVHRQLRKTNEYNAELRSMVERVSGELHRVKNSKPVNKLVQVDKEDFLAYTTGAATMPAWIQDDKPAEPVHAETEDRILAAGAPTVSTSCGPVKQCSVADAIKEVAESVVQQQQHETLTHSGYVYDPASGLYYHSETGYYYDTERQLFYEPKTGIYYYYDYNKGTYEFHSQVDLQPDATAMQSSTSFDASVNATKSDLDGMAYRNRKERREAKIRRNREILDGQDRRCLMNHHQGSADLAHLQSPIVHRLTHAGDKDQVGNKCRHDRDDRNLNNDEDNLFVSQSRSHSRERLKKRIKHRHRSRSKSKRKHKKYKKRKSDKLESPRHHRKKRKRRRNTASGADDVTTISDEETDVEIAKNGSDTTQAEAFELMSVEYQSDDNERRDDLTNCDLQLRMKTDGGKGKVASTDSDKIDLQDNDASYCSRSTTDLNDHSEKSDSALAEEIQSSQNGHSSDETIEGNKSHKHRHKRSRSSNKDKTYCRTLSVRKRTSGNGKSYKKHKRRRNASDSYRNVDSAVENDGMESGECSVSESGELTSDTDSSSSNYSDSSHEYIDISDDFSDSKDDKTAGGQAGEDGACRNEAEATSIGPEGSSEQCGPYGKWQPTDQPEHDQEVASNWPPCIRMVVTESTCLPIGTLFIVPYTGATVGREKSDITIADINVSKCHAKISYNEDARVYELVDLGSQNGTIVNRKRISHKKQRSLAVAIVHGDRVMFGDTCLLCHIHAGTETCDECEPGIVIANQPAAPRETEPVLSKEEKKKLQRQQLNQIKRKYGLQSAPYLEPQSAIKQPGYEDKAASRRNTVGSDVPGLKTQPSASSTRAISKDNIGHKMLSKMGWKEGDTLGKNNEGLQEPIIVSLRANQSAGLGSPSAGQFCMDAAGSVDVRKAARRAQAQHRYNQIKATGAQTDQKSRTWTQGQTEFSGS